MSEMNLKLEAPGETVFRTGDAPKIFQYEGYQYRADSTDSFVKLLKMKADNQKAVVFINTAGFHAIVDTHVVDRQQDTITYAYELSTLAREWIPILQSAEGKVFTIKQMTDFLKRRDPGEIDDIETFLFAAQNFRYVKKVEGDFTRDNSQNYVMAIKVGESEGTVKVPSAIYANIALLEGSDFVQQIEVEVEIHRPNDMKEGQPGFLLTCPKYQRYLGKAQQNEAAKMEHELNGFLVVKGHSEK